jgi:hypothetical protein
LWCWENVHPIIHECLQFWSDHEDLIWAKSIWPILEDIGFYSDHDDEAFVWTGRQTPSHPIPAPRPGPTRPGPLKSNFLSAGTGITAASEGRT